MDTEYKKVLLNLMQGAEYDDPGVLRSWEGLKDIERIRLAIVTAETALQNDIDKSTATFDQGQQRLLDANLAILERNLELWLEKVKEARKLVESK